MYQEITNQRVFEWRSSAPEDLSWSLCHTTPAPAGTPPASAGPGSSTDSLFVRFNVLVNHIVNIIFQVYVFTVIFKNSIVHTLINTYMSKLLFFKNPSRNGMYWIYELVMYECYCINSLYVQ